MKIYRVWNEFDPNDVFEIEAESPADAAFAALGELGWLVGEGHDNEDEDEDADEEATA